MTLWRDRLSQITLAVTTLFWGAGATLQFIVLKWGEVKLGLPLDKGALLQGVTAIGIALGSVQPMILAMLHRATPPDRHGHRSFGRSRPEHLRPELVRMKY